MILLPLVVALIAAPSRPDTHVDIPRILVFHAEWCQPCQKMKPKIAELVRKKYPIESIDIDENPELAHRYGVSGVPAFVVVDGKGKVLARTQGYQPASDLAAFYREARDKAQSESASAAGTLDDDEPATDQDSPADDAPPRRDRKASRRTTTQDDPDQDAEPQAKPNPDPWATVVRIKVLGNGMIGYGSGTIISSTPEESIILTCAHIFHVEGVGGQLNPRRYPFKVAIDLFDGKIHGLKPAVVHCIERDVPGVVIDFDSKSDVGLIKIRPGRRLPAAQVVPPSWKPEVEMEMTTVGCSEGHDATAWSTKVTNVGKFRLPDKPSYSAIECVHAPRQGRSGGGLFNREGYLAGVCNFAFADPRYPRGLYASPSSIYLMLDRNRLASLYDPKTKGQGSELLADRDGGRKNEPRVITRAQSPDDEAPRGRRITLPPHDLLGIRTDPDQSDRSVTRRTGWLPNDQRAKSGMAKPVEESLADQSNAEGPQSGSRTERFGERRDADGPVTTNMQIDPTDDADAFQPLRKAEKPAKPVGGWRSSKN